MMMIGETMVMNPKVETLPWDSLEDPAAAIASYFTNPYVFNSNAAGNASSGESPTAFESLCEEDMHLAVDAFSCDHFRMFEFKVRTCARGRSHDWTKCPYAHPGEKARRRDPRKHHYSGTECPELRHGCCKKGDSCEFSHGVFESWLHPNRYRTQPCRDGMSCRRRVCFFAHSTEQLRLPSKQNRRSPRAKGTSISSPTSILLSPSISPSSDSPPMSPISPINSSESFASASRLVTLMHNLQLGDSQETPQSQWGNNPNMSGFCSPRVSSLRQGQQATFDLWDKAYEEEPAMERVESGKNLRAQMYAKLMRENSVERVHSWPPLISAGSRN